MLMDDRHLVSIMYIVKILLYLYIKVKINNLSYPTYPNGRTAK